jgi:AcrR family transcriptional regulator
MPRSSDAVRATDGRVPGRRGIATRQRLLDCTHELLGKRAYRDIKVIDIAREAGTSPATFYQYFPDVEQAVLVLAEGLDADVLPIAQLIRTGEWDGDAGPDTARTVVRRFLEYWDEHRAIFRVVDLATEEGDLRFQRLRVRALGEITQALADTITDQQRHGGLGPEVDPTAEAFVLIAMLAHCAAHQYGFEFWGVRTSAQVETIARIVYGSITGRRLPAAKPAPKNGTRRSKRSARAR